MYIHISNLNRQVTTSDILTLLGGYISVGYCAIRHLRNTETRQTNTFVLVDITDPAEAEAIITAFNNTLLGGRKILIQIGQ